MALVVLTAKYVIINTTDKTKALFFLLSSKINTTNEEVTKYTSESRHTKPRNTEQYYNISISLKG
jgi:hypothetical protein